jgi:heme/copper-type cytochrome/quinol oxidase subunit 2
MQQLHEPDPVTEERDQREFDEAVNRGGKYLLEALAGLGIIVAIALSAIALARSGKTSPTRTVTQVQVRQAPAAAPPAASKPAAAPVVNLKIIGAYKPGPDGRKHDAFTKTDFAVKVGQPLELRINNTDDVAHNIVSPLAGVHITVAPGTHTYTLIVKTAGHFAWLCTIPCDSDANGWAMQHSGYMSGYITAT